MKLSVLFDLGRKRRGAAAPCIHWEDPVLNMASGVCKAYIRGALASDWFWNKFSQALLASRAKAGACLERLTVCLTSTRSSQVHLESSWSLARSGRSFRSEREWASHHSHTPNAPLGPRGGHPLCLQTCFGRRLSIIGRKAPLCPRPFPLSSHACPVSPPGTLGTEWMVLVPFGF